tara:strand:+ start:10992 stop:12230 length:1239 start_codon:yes stop_codon:yes gene_type:complete
MEIWVYVAIIIVGFIVLEAIFRYLIFKVNRVFQWLILQKDEYPKLPLKELEKFFEHGYDQELGWVRKPNTEHNEIGKNSRVTKWTTNSNASRANPDFDDMHSEISCYGDSFTFCRQVNDNETWEHYLSKSLNTNIQNFGVGNYGIDQSLLYLKKNFQKNKTNIIILAVVPDTISRIVSVWKHYYEYGNTFGFKPRFFLQKNNLILNKNPINSQEKFSNYEKYLEEIRNSDFFYKNKFRKEKISFPYSITVFRNAKRNFRIIYWVLKIQNLKKKGIDTKDIDWNPMKIIMEINLKWRLRLFKDSETTKLLKEIIQEFSDFAKTNESKPVFAFLPQKDDLIFIKKNHNFFQNFLNELNSIKDLHIIDFTNILVKDPNLDELFSDNNEYGGHYSKYGNEVIASIFEEELKNKKII